MGPWSIWEDNIRIDMEEMGVNVRKWFDPAQNKDYWRVLVNVSRRVPEVVALVNANRNICSYKFALFWPLCYAA